MNSAISDFGFRYRLPNYPCASCDSKGGFANHFVYPHVDPRDALTEPELKLIRWRERVKVDDPAPYHDVAAKLQDYFKIPVGPHTTFSPFKIKVSYRPKQDVTFMEFWGHDLFLRRATAEKIRNAGVEFEWVTPSAAGSKAAELDFVQVIMPLAGYGGAVTRCGACFRTRDDDAGFPKEKTAPLYDGPEIHRLNLFKTINGGSAYYSQKFVETARALGLSGFKDAEILESRGIWTGGDILPTEPQPDPAPSRISIPWPRSNITEASKIQPAPAPKKVPLNREAAEQWIGRLERFLSEIKSRNGNTELKQGNEFTRGKEPQSLAAFLQACGGKFAFSFEDGDRIGGLAIDSSTFANLRKQCRTWAKETWVADEPEEKAKWMKAIPFAALPNGDFLALDGRKKSSDPAVLYLNHEDASEPLKESLADFLSAWEKLGYAGPFPADFLE